MAVYSEPGGVAGLVGVGGGVRASETEHLLCSRLAFRESDRETLTLENLEV